MSSRFALLLALTVASVRPAAAQLSNGAIAIDALGEVDSVTDQPVYTKGNTNNTPNAVGLYGPSAVALDATNHRLFVADTFNYRVVVYTLNGTNNINSRTMTNVIGQVDFNSSIPASVANSTGMYEPRGLAYDAVDNQLFVADATNNRVLVYNTASITNGMGASFVLGQGNFGTNGTAFTASGMSSPAGLAFDATNLRLFVADSNNSRVLVFNTEGIFNGAPAVIALGQTNVTSSGTTSAAANTLNDPTALAYDPNNLRLFVADTGYNRVLVYNADPRSIGSGESASDVIGQATFAGNSGDTSGAAYTMYAPQGLVYDKTSDRLFVADANNSRILTFTGTANISTGSASASFVIGETGFGVVGGGLSATQLATPLGLEFDPTNTLLFVADSQNYRVMVFSGNSLIGNGPTASDEVGVTDTSGNALFTEKGSAQTNLGFNSPGGVAIDTVTHRLFVADTSNDRVVVYTLNSSNAISNRVMAFVLGEANFTSDFASNASTGMSRPADVAYDQTTSRLFVADRGNNRVLVFNAAPASLANNMPAAVVLGQTGFNLSVPTFSPATASGMDNPNGVAYDSSGSRLFVSDTNNNRVLIFTNATSLSNGVGATAVLGQSGLGNNTGALTQSGMHSPAGLAYDPAGRLFVSDSSNLRVLVFSSFATGASADSVIGQANFTSNTPATTQNGMGWTNGDSTYGPAGLAYDPLGKRLFVSDYGNNRVLVYYAAQVSTGMAASYVLGQPNFTTNPMNTTQNGLCWPTGIAYDGKVNLYVADQANNRVLAYNADTLPTTPSFGTIGSSTLTVTWGASGAGSGGYVIQASTKADFSGTVISSATSNSAATTLTVNGLVPNTTYFVQLGALNGPTTSYATALTTSTLVVPVNTYFGSIVTSTSIYFSWGSAGNPAGTLYVVSVSSSFPPGVTATSSATYNLFLSSGGLTPNETLWFQVIAINNNGIPQAGSFAVTKTTLGGSSTPPPTNPALSAVYTSSIAVSWIPVASNGYVLNASTAPDFSGTLFSSTTTDGSASGLTVSGLTGGTLYFLQAGAIWPTTTTFASSLSTTTAPLTPTVPVLSGLAVTSSTIRWNWTGANASVFLLWSSSGSLIAALSGSTSYYVQSGLMLGTTYASYVEGLNASGFAFSSTVTVATPASFTLCLGQGSMVDPLTNSYLALQFPYDLTTLPLQFLLSPNPLLQPMTDTTQSLISKANTGLSPSLQGSTTSIREFLAVQGSVRYTGTFSDNVVIQIPYSDVNNTGFVDGSSPSVAVANLQMYTINETTGAWVLVPGSTVDTTHKLVKASVNHMSVFGVFGAAGAGPGAISGSVLGSVRVYPNPYRPGSNDPNLGGGGTGITFDSLQPSTAIKIYTMTGQLVAQLNASSSVQVWDARNGSGRDVASGLYFAVITSPGNSTLTKKLLIIR